VANGFGFPIPTIPAIPAIFVNGLNGKRSGPPLPLPVSSRFINIHQGFIKASSSLINVLHQGPSISIKASLRSSVFICGRWFCISDSGDYGDLCEGPER
jgi:hypothetical protein